MGVLASELFNTKKYIVFNIRQNDFLFFLFFLLLSFSVGVVFYGTLNSKALFRTQKVLEKEKIYKENDIMLNDQLF